MVQREAEPDVFAPSSLPPDDPAEFGASVEPELLAMTPLARRFAPHAQRLAVELHYFVGLDVADTAAAMACSAGTVKSTLHDARARLRTLLGDDT